MVTIILNKRQTRREPRGPGPESCRAQQRSCTALPQSTARWRAPRACYRPPDLSRLGDQLTVLRTPTFCGVVRPGAVGLAAARAKGIITLAGRRSMGEEAPPSSEPELSASTASPEVAYDAAGAGASASAAGARIFSFATKRSFAIEVDARTAAGAKLGAVDGACWRGVIDSITFDTKVVKTWSGPSSSTCSLPAASSFELCFSRTPAPSSLGDGFSVVVAAVASCLSRRWRTSGRHCDARTPSPRRAVVRSLSHLHKVDEIV